MTDDEACDILFGSSIEDQHRKWVQRLLGEWLRAYERGDLFIEPAGRVQMSDFSGYRGEVLYRISHLVKAGAPDPPTRPHARK